MRRALLITALLASHGSVLWLARNSPVSAASSPEGPPLPQAPKRESSQLACFLRSVEAAAETNTRQEEETEEPDQEALLAAARAAIPPDADVVAMVRAADPDLPVSAETCAAFSLWVARDPVAALRFLSEWKRDAPDSVEFSAEFSRHLQENGLAQLGLYLREVPEAQPFLLEVAGEVVDEREPDFVLQIAGGLSSIEDRVDILASRFANGKDLAGQLAAIHRILGDSGASEFLSSILSRRFPNDPGILAELEQSGFPPYAVAQFRVHHSGSTGGQSRTNADFIGSMVSWESGQFPVVPEATGTNVVDIVTSGLRSGDGKINRNNIDAILNNPDRASTISMADKIRGYFTSDNSINWTLFDASDLAGFNGLEEGGEQFLRGKITGDAWLDALQESVPGGSALRDEITILAFRSIVEEDPRRAVALLSPSLPHQNILMRLPSVSPEVLLLVADRLSGDAGLSQEATQVLAEQFQTWFAEDPETCAARVADMPAGALREHLLSQMKEEGSE